MNSINDAELQMLLQRFVSGRDFETGLIRDDILKDKNNPHYTRVENTFSEIIKAYHHGRRDTML